MTLPDLIVFLENEAAIRINLPLIICIVLSLLNSQWILSFVFISIIIGLQMRFDKGSS